MRILTIAALCGVCILGSVGAASAESGTTRIETRPFYGAVVTIEEGVRVFRPLPTTKRVIVNPGGVTPLSLGFNETTVNERRYNYNYNSVPDQPATRNNVNGVYPWGYGYGRGFYGRRGHFGGGHRGRGVHGLGR